MRTSEQETQGVPNPEAVRLYDILRNTPKQVNMNLFHQREAGEHQEDMSSGPEGVTHEDTPLDARWGDEVLPEAPIRLVRTVGMGVVETNLSIGVEMQHVFPIYCGAMPEADAAVGTIGAWVQSRTHA